MRLKIVIPVFLLALPAVAHAEVIEISDDGEARIVGSAGPSAIVDTSLNDPFDDAGRRYGVDPKLLRAVAWTESRGRSDAVSPKGARGVMQLMPATAAELGVDPNDPAANINGGAAYLARQITTFHDIPLALAAYNAGPGAVTRYGGIPPYRETQAYVSAIMQRWSGPPGSKAPAPTTASSGVAKSADSADQRPFTRTMPIMLIEVPST